MRNAAIGIVLLPLVVMAAGCEATKSSNPLSPEIAGPIPGVNISAPAAVDPSAGAQIDTTRQPVTLVVQNASTNGVRPLNYLFEVATDVNFATRVFSREGIAPGDGRTSLRLPDPLAPERTYYWRARAQDGANTGQFMAPMNFDVFTPVVIQAPAALSPINNEVTSTNQPVFVIGNASRTGPAGAILYGIELSDSDTFANKIAVWTVAEQAGQTRLGAPVWLAAGRYFWRTRAADATHTGPYSSTQTFRVPAPVQAPAPSPTPGAGSCGPPFPAPLGIVQCRRAQFGTPMSSSDHVAFLRGVAGDLNKAGVSGGPFGLLRKSGGSSCSGYACDIICSGQGSGQQQWDVLADSEGSATPVWDGPKTGSDIRVDVCEIQ